jgi:hypothetical protein
MIGPGKYDDECTMVRDRTDGSIVFVVVINGDRGTGFSVQATDPGLLRSVPDILEGMAAQIRKDLQ